MSNVPKIGPISYDFMPTNRYAVKLSDLSPYGGSPVDAIRAFAEKEGAKPYSVFRFPDGEYVVFEYPEK